MIVLHDIEPKISLQTDETLSYKISDKRCIMLSLRVCKILKIAIVTNKLLWLDIKTQYRCLQLYTLASTFSNCIFAKVQ